MIEQKRCCENCGNLRCDDSLVAFWWYECVDTDFEAHWMPKEEYRERIIELERIKKRGKGEKIMKITDKQLIVLQHMYRTQEGSLQQAEWWSEITTNDLSSTTTLNVTSIGAIITTLIQKGIIKTTKRCKAKIITLTELGCTVINTLARENKWEVS